MAQSNLFEKENLQKRRNSLIITKQARQQLSKQQQTFNTLVKKIEKLRLELDKTTRSLNERLDLYVKFILPLEQKITDLRKEVSRLLYKFLKSKKLFSSREKTMLKEVISVQLDQIFQFEKSEPDDELKTIFKTVEGMSFEEAADEDFNLVKDEMASVLEEYGIDVDLDVFNREMTEEEMLVKMKEMQEQMEQQAAKQQQEAPRRKKTKKQLEKEKREKLVAEARTKNISSIYKQLVKILHPDLEQDEDLKLQKEELMKQLTVAYQNNDLHTMLRLELAWVQKEGTSTDQLTNDKLDIYNEMLREQVVELENEIQMLLEHPRYEPLLQMARYPWKMESINVAFEKQKMEATVRDMAGSITRLKGNEIRAVAEVKSILAAFRNQNNFDIGDLEEFFR
jgi:hypothetical protein